MYKLVNCCKSIEDSLNVYHQGNETHEQEVTTKANGNYEVRINLKEVFEFVEHQENVTYGIGYMTTLQTKSDDIVWINWHGLRATETARLPVNRTIGGKIQMVVMSSYVTHLVPKRSPQKLMLEQFVSRSTTESVYNKKYVFSKMYPMKKTQFLSKEQQKELKLSFIL